MMKEGRGLDLMDSVLLDSAIPEQVMMCVNLSLLCVQEDPNDRPTMSYVANMLSSIESANLPAPKSPTFCRKGYGHVMDSPFLDVSRSSINEITVSNIDPR